MNDKTIIARKLRNNLTEAEKSFGIFLFDTRRERESIIRARFPPKADPPLAEK